MQNLDEREDRVMKLFTTKQYGSVIHAGMASDWYGYKAGDTEVKGVPKLGTLAIGKSVGREREENRGKVF